MYTVKIYKPIYSVYFFKVFCVLQFWVCGSVWIHTFHVVYVDQIGG